MDDILQQAAEACNIAVMQDTDGRFVRSNGEKTFPWNPMHRDADSFFLLVNLAKRSQFVTMEFKFGEVVVSNESGILSKVPLPVSCARGLQFHAAREVVTKGAVEWHQRRKKAIGRS